MLRISIIPWHLSASHLNCNRFAILIIAHQKMSSWLWSVLVAGVWSSVCPAGALNQVEENRTCSSFEEDCTHTALAESAVPVVGECSVHNLQTSTVCSPFGIYASLHACFMAVCVWSSMCPVCVLLYVPCVVSVRVFAVHLCVYPVAV